MLDELRRNLANGARITEGSAILAIRRMEREALETVRHDCAAAMAAASERNSR